MKSRIIAGLGAATVVIGGLLVAAPSASATGAPIIWYQAVARPSADTACPTTSAEDATAGWTEWTGSWEQWPNEGKGGDVCTRSITWAYEADTAGGGFPSGGCEYAGYTYPRDFWAQFNGGYALPANTLVFTQDTCTYTDDSYLTYDSVFAPTGYDPDVLCQAAWGKPAALQFGDLWACKNPG